MVPNIQIALMSCGRLEAGFNNSGLQVYTLENYLDLV